MNTAGNLAQALERLIAKNTSRSDSVSKAWARTFGVREDTSEFLTCTTALYSQYEGALLEIETCKASDRAKRLFTNAAHKVSKFVNPVSVNQLKVNQLDSHRSDIDTLFLASEAIGSRLVPDLNPLTLEELISELTSIKAEISGLDIDERFRKIILDQLSLILISILSYETLGPDGAAKVYGGAVAELARLSRQEAIKPNEKSAAGKAIGVAKKVGEVVVWAAAVISGASGILEDGSALLGLTMPSDSSDDAG